MCKKNSRMNSKNNEVNKVAFKTQKKKKITLKKIKIKNCSSTQVHMTTWG